MIEYSQVFNHRINFIWNENIRNLIPNLNIKI